MLRGHLPTEREGAVLGSREDLGLATGSAESVAPLLQELGMPPERKNQWGQMF